MGAALSWRLAARLTAAGADPAAVSVESLLHPLARTAGSVVGEGTLRTALAGAMQGVFVMAFVAAALGFVATALAPRGRIDQLGVRRARAEDHHPVKPTGVPLPADKKSEEPALE